MDIKDRCRLNVDSVLSFWWPVKRNIILSLSLAALSLSACTTEQSYDSAQAWQRNQCNKIPDKTEFDRCMSNASTSYESYKRQTESARQ